MMPIRGGPITRTVLQRLRLKGSTSDFTYARSVALLIMVARASVFVMPTLM
jgi:hypothetical protein